MSGKPFAVTRRPGGKCGWEWKLEEERVRKMACSQPLLGVGGGDLFFNDEDVFCVNVKSFDVLHIRDEEILPSIPKGRGGGNH
jgi:hypothetical protein